MHTPWGESDHCEVVAQGFCSVSTPSHGGMVITEAFARHYKISQAALDAAEHRYGKYFFEEDCAWCVLMWELPQFWFTLLKSLPNPKEYLHGCISRWNAEYFDKIGETCNPEDRAKYDELQKLLVRS